MADPESGKTGGAAPSHIHIEKKKTNWLAWIALIAGILALLLALSRCGSDRNETTARTTDVVATTPNAADSTVLTGTSGLGAYLAGSDPAPRRFEFEAVNFDTASSAVREADQSEIASIAAVLSQYPNARVQIAGYADSRGPSDANIALGQARADSVKAALVARGVDGNRITTDSGGDSDPIDTNETAAGQAENRRTELVVIQR